MIVKVVIYRVAKTMENWTVAEAKARLSELMERARSAGPQTITKNGKDAVVVVAAEDWVRRNARKGSLVDFLRKSPLAGTDIRIDRDKASPRKIDL
jgi:prevent-host-death family protein